MSPSTHAMVAASSAVNAPTHAMSAEHLGHEREQRLGAGHHEDAGRDHGGGVDERGHRRRPLHRVGEPHVQRELGGLAHGAQVDQEHDEAEPLERASRALLRHPKSAGNSKVPVAAHSITMPMMKPRSPSLVIQNALTAARAAAGRSYQ